MNSPITTQIQVSRNPTKSEIKFGHGCTIFNHTELPVIPSLRPKFVVIDGMKYRVPR